MEQKEIINKLVETLLIIRQSIIKAQFDFQMEIGLSKSHIDIEFSVHQIDFCLCLIRSDVQSLLKELEHSDNPNT